MAGFALASPDDVAALVGRDLSDAESAQTYALIDLASAVVRNRVPDVDARVTAGTLDALLVAGVVASMVARMVRNPAGVTQRVSGSVSVTFAPGGDGGLFLTTDELALLRPFARAGLPYTARMGIALGYGCGPPCGCERSRIRGW